VHLVRYATDARRHPQVGTLHADGTLRPLDVPSIGALLRLPLGDIRAYVEASATAAVVDGPRRYLPPADGRMEIWAAGVTYYRSRQARMEESTTADLYDLVYDADRPELFFKCVPWRAVTDGEPVSVRRDSTLDVPEPELTVVVNADGQIAGYGICDDVSSRSIEGDNPLYLPQAKIYAGSCSLATGIRPAWEVDTPDALGITMEIARDGAVAWSGAASTADIRRPPQDLVDHLFREEQFPEGVIISTGTGIVPDMDFTLRPGDVVTIRIDEIGVLANTVVPGRDHFAWLDGAADDPMTRPA
jgi:2-dehydro-3-deoxy-D-arabinonate dehydratase